MLVCFVRLGKFFWIIFCRVFFNLVLFFVLFLGILIRRRFVRFIKVEMKEKMLRVVREKGRVIHKGKFIRLIVDFSVEIL